MEQKITGKEFGTPPADLRGGELLRQGRVHECAQPSPFTDHWGPGAVWRCPCGKRWILGELVDKFGEPHREWFRRYWPWPR